MADFSFLFGPLAANEEAANAGAPRPDEIAAVLKEWRREGLAVELPKARIAETQRREQVFGELLKEFPVFAQSRELIYNCHACHSTFSLPALTERVCPVCKGPIEEVRAAEVVKIGNELGARFTSSAMPSFHLSMDTLIRTLDLPRWFLDLGPHMRQMRRIPVNFANFGVLLGLVAAIPFAIFALIASFLDYAPGYLFWRVLSSIAATTVLVLIGIRPLLQTYVHVGRDKIMLMGFGMRKVLHFQNIESVRNVRRLNGFGYAAYLGRRYGSWAQWVYGVLLQWFDPRSWGGWYGKHVIDGLPDLAGDATAPYWRHHIVIKGNRQTIVMPYNARLRRDLTQALAVVVFQVRAMSVNAKIELTALQAAQKGRATQEQWAAGIRR
jgi:hypothetical protein